MAKGKKNEKASMPKLSVIAQRNLLERVNKYLKDEGELLGDLQITALTIRPQGRCIEYIDVPEERIDRNGKKYIVIVKKCIRYSDS